MKKHIIASLIAGLFLCISCRDKTVMEDGGTIIEILIPKFADGENLDSILNILSKRLEIVYPENNPTVIFDNFRQLIQVEIPRVSPDYVNYLLFSPGRSELVEIFDANTIMKRLSEAVTQSQYETFRRLIYQNNNWGILGYVSLRDTAMMNRLFGSKNIIEVLGGEDSFNLFWSSDSIYGYPIRNEWQIPLCGVKKRNDFPDLNTLCESSTVKKLFFLSSPIVKIKLKNEYKPLINKIPFERGLAVTLDNDYLFNRFTYKRASDDALLISNFSSENDAILFKALLTSGVIKSDLLIRTIDYYN